MKRILITPRSLTKSFHPALNKLKDAGFELIFSTSGKQPSEEDLIKLLPGCVGYLAGVEKITKRGLESARDLKVISRNGSGIDNIDLDAAKSLNIRVCKTEGANAKGVAELTIGLMFSLVRSIPLHDARMKKETWERRKGIELENRTLGLIGCGEIGRKLAILALGLGMRVLAYRRNPDPSFSPSDKFHYCSFDDLLTQSDIISMHRPASASGEPVINAQVIAKMKKGVYIINTARASLIDEEAILEELSNNQIAGFATDVYDKEPPEDFSLVKHDRIIATPHLGGYTTESVDRATRAAVENLINSL